MDGTPFGRYRLVELLGRGGMGEVWRAFDTDTDRMVAVKVLSAHLAADPEFQQRFRREAKAAAMLNEPHVVPIHHFGVIDERLYVDMRFIEGRDLQTLLNDGPMGIPRAVSIVEQIGMALDAAHEAGLIHRDVKPSNILVAKRDFAYLIDFGIARAASETGLTATGNAIGTWAYMAPERISGTTDVDARSDVYALACVLHECLTSQKPYPGTTFERLAGAHLFTPPPRPTELRPDLPDAFDAVIARGMAKDPKERYQTTMELTAAAMAAATTSSAAVTKQAAPPDIPDQKTLVIETLSVRPPPPPPVYVAPVQPPAAWPHQIRWSRPGDWVTVATRGDDHFGMVGRVVSVDDVASPDGLDVIVEFHGDAEPYAFRHDELQPAQAPPTSKITPAPTTGDFWMDVGIDPIRIITESGSLLTLRCYFDDALFLGSRRHIDVFRSERALRRYLAENEANDMSSVSTYAAVANAAMDGSLRVGDVPDNCVYVLTGLADDIAAGANSVDYAQLELAVELLTEVAQYVRSSLVEQYLRKGQPLGDLVDAVLVPKPNPRRLPSREAAEQWRALADFLESRLRHHR